MTWLLNLVSGGLVGDLVNGLRGAWKDYLTADTDEKKIAAKERIAFFQGQIALAQTAAQNDKWWSTRELMAKCVLILVAKLIVWDTVLGLGTTPDPGATVNGILWTIIGFYYGSKAATDVAAKFMTALTQRAR